MSNWVFERLDSVEAKGAISFGRGNIISKDDIAAFPGPYPIYSSSAQNNGKFGEYGKFMFDEELVTWSVDGGGALFYRDKHKYSVTNVCGYLRVKNASFDTRFVYYCLAEQHRHLSFDYTTKAHPSVIKRLYSLPDISKTCQEKIANILQTIDQAIEQTEVLIEKYSLVKAGVMHDLFTRGLTPDGKLRPPREEAPDLYKATPIGWIPADWAYGKFGDNVAVIDPNPSHRYPNEVTEGYPICSTENFYGEDGFDFKKSKLVPEKTFQEQNNRCQYKELDVIFARKGRIGFARRYGSDRKAFSHTVVVMKPITPHIDVSWLLWLSRSDWLLKAIERRMNTNSGVPTLGVDFIKNIEVPIPSPEEQHAANTALEAASQRIQIETDKKNKLTLQKAGLMQDLLTGKIQVKLNDPEAAHV